MKKSFILYTEWEDAFDQQPNDIAGELIKAIFDYVRTESVPMMPASVVSAIFSVLKPAIDRNIKKYEDISEKRREAGKKGGAPKGNANAKKTSKNKQNKQVEAKQPDSDSVSDSDIIISDNKKEIDTKKDGRSLSVTPSEFDKFNTWLKSECPFVLKLATQMTEKEYFKLTAKYNKEELREALTSLNNWKDFPKKRTNVYRSTLDELKKKYGER